MKAVVVIPTYNERKSIVPLVDKILGLELDIDMLFIDDNSPDGTGEQLDEMARRLPSISVIHRPEKRGLGSAYIAGFQAVLERKPDYIIQMDADLSHDPTVIPKLLETAESYDLAIGSRYIEGINVVNWPFRRLFLSVMANHYVRWLTGMKIKDCTSGFRCFKRSVLERIHLDHVISNGYAFQIEMVYRTLKEGFRVCEIPIIFWGRTSGKSKLSGKVIREAVILPWKIRFGLVR